MARKDAIKKYCGLSRRILACTMVGCMVFSFAGNVSVPVVYAVEAEEVTKVGNYTDDQGIKYKLYSDGTCEVNYSSGLKGDIILPENVTYNDKNYRITSIGEFAFYYCSGLTSITIPTSVTSIGYHAFSGCSGLTSIAIPTSVTSIGDNAFENCSGLTSITISSSVTSIGDNAFEDCSSLTSITIPSSVTSIGSAAFWKCSSLTSNVI